MTNQPEVSFIICTYNRADYLDDTLDSIIQNSRKNLNFELLIIDNNSQDHTEQIVKKYQHSPDIDNKSIRYIKEPKQGLSHARNRGIQESKTPYVVFLDDDIRATSSLITAWISFFNEHPKALAAGGKIHVQFDDPRPVWMSYFLLPLLGRHDTGKSVRKYSINSYPFGGNMGFKKTIFDEIDLFNTDLGRKGESMNAGEEKELFRRIRSKSNEIYYVPDAFLYHRVNAERLTIDYIRNQGLGLGKSMKMRLENASFSQYLANWASEAGKFLVSLVLALGYILIFQAPKAKLLILFRWWIWRGYRNF